tara:strand:- start:68591 stop:68860 length:270 start_codon:yes stop_codon:yes gene_type:complete
MKNIKLIIVGIVMLSIGLTSFISMEDSRMKPPYEPTYCEGWEAGYVQGWCYEIPNCIKPVVPVCPVAKVNQHLYIDGYNRGFLKGKSNR